MPKAIGIVVAVIFGGIGLTVLVFLWSAPFNDFHSPPLFFRVFGSFIALAFIAFAAGAVYTALTGHTGLAGPTPPVVEEFGPSPDRGQPRPVAAGYACPRCAAPLSTNAEVSPLGDAKCPHCGGWYNIHGRTT